MPPSSNQNPEDEKLLTGTAEELFLPELSPKEFLLHTPTHELRNIFGVAAGEKILTPPSNPTPPIKTPSTPPPIMPTPAPKMEKLMTPDTFATLEQRAKLKRPFFSFFISILLVAFVIVIALYIYGWYLARN